MSDLHRGAGEAFEISPRTSVAHVKLRVYDIQRSLDFYEQLLGFKTIGKTLMKMHSSLHRVMAVRNILSTFLKWIMNAL